MYTEEIMVRLQELWLALLEGDGLSAYETRHLDNALRFATQALQTVGCIIPDQILKNFGEALGMPEHKYQIPLQIEISHDK